MLFSKLCPGEWDIDSANRKFKGSYCVFMNMKTQVILGTLYCVGFIDKNLVHYSDPETGRVNESAEIMPIYQRIQAGWYEFKQGLIRDGLPKCDSPHVLITRALGKMFTVGLNDHTHNIRTPNMQSVFMSMGGDKFALHKPLTINKEQAIEDSGPISREIYFAKDSVRYMDRLVGMRYKDRILVEDVVNQEVLDAIRGTKCKLVHA